MKTTALLSIFMITQVSAETWNPPVKMSAATQLAADTFSWETFIALNWPVKSGSRGNPDPALRLGGSHLTVWESYKTTDQIFLTNAQNPGPWNTSLFNKNKVALPTRSLFSTSKVSMPQVRNFKKIVAPTPHGTGEAVGGTLTDQNGNLTYFERSTNEIGYNYIQTNHFYNATKLDQAPSVNYPSGAINVKASWRILIEGKDPIDTFHSRPAVIDGKNVTIGLVGLHLVTKAPGTPQWIWSTFEHKSNAPSIGEKPSGYYSYNKPNCPAEKCPPNVSTEKNGKPTAKPTQVVRETVIPQGTTDVKAIFQKQLKGTVWENYNLVGTQWPTLPSNPGLPTGRPTPTILANTTMETYIQTHSSCIQCHSTANSTTKSYDFTFMLFAAQKPTVKVKPILP